jgi:hypothetical protein
LKKQYKPLYNNAMADISSPEFNIKKRTENTFFNRLKNQKFATTLQSNAAQREEGAKIADRLEGELDRINKSMAETPLPGVLPGSEREFTQRIQKAQVDAELTPPTPPLTQAENEHNALVDFVSNPANHGETSDLDAARPANVLPEPEGLEAPLTKLHPPTLPIPQSPLEAAHRDIARSEAEAKQRRAGILERNAAARESILSTLNTTRTEAPFSVDRNDQGGMSVNRPDTTQTSIRDRVRSRIASFMSRLPKRT